MVFPISGVDTPFWLPPLVALLVSAFTSTGGVSGAFLLLPFQMSVLGFTSPAVSPTNLVYNVVSIPSGVYRYFREGRMIWPLMWVVVAGTLPGVVGGGLLRLTYLPDPKPFKVFAGLVLLYIGLRLVVDLRRGRRQGAPAPKAAGGPPPDWQVRKVQFTWLRLSFEFQGKPYACSTPGIFLLSVVVGVVGGIYGIGGGAIMAPFFVAFYGLPVHTVAGAALMGTFVTSIAGVVFYQLIAPLYSGSGLAVAPDWLLGGLFGLGGLMGMYLGARMQRYLPAHWIKAMLVVVLLTVGLRYLASYFI